MSAAPGTGIPRLQELDFLLTTATEVSRGSTFDQIRRALIDHMSAARIRDAGTGNTATFQLAKENRFRYVSNAADALKELMRLGYVINRGVPSEPKAAPHYSKATYSLTEAGEVWAAKVANQDLRGAYDELLSRLWNLHPHFSGYLRLLQTGGFVIPLLAWADAPEPRTRERYVEALARRVATGLASEAAGWTATIDDVRTALETYIAARVTFAANQQRAQTFARTQDFVTACEGAVVKLAFTRAGCPLDYISHEVLRRWMRVLGVANFSYYVPGKSALRLWSTADIIETEEPLMVRRRVGDQHRDKVLSVLGEAYESVREADRSGPAWVPIYRLRAAVGWRLRVSDGVFNQAVLDFLEKTRGADAPFALQLDLAQYGSVPPTERGLIIPSKRGLQTYYSMSLVRKSERLVQ